MTAALARAASECRERAARGTAGEEDRNIVELEETETQRIRAV
jgi:hypothetical protein